MIEEMQKKCFAYNGGKCNILTVMDCRLGNCRFYKTKEEFEEGQKRYDAKESDEY